MDLRRSEITALNNLGSLWKTTPGAEYEAMLTGLDLTGWQDVIQYLRSLGMREAPQLVKLNICLSNDIRITLEGAGVIQAYCRDNRIGDKPFVAMLKENIADAEPVTLKAYSAKAKLKREIPLAPDDARVKEALARWDQLGKHFRNIQRFEFIAPGAIPLRFDISIVRENAGKPARTFQEAHVTTQPPRYEVEVELTAVRASTTPEKAASLIIRGLSWLLQGRQRSFVLTTIQASDYVLGSLNRIFNGGGGGSNRNYGGRGFRYPGPQPATLERRNLTDQSEPGVPNLRTMRGGYNVTDKADGLRCLLFVAENGRVFLVDGGGRVYSTSKQVDATGTAGVVLDGEWIRRDRKGAPVSHYYAFDILAAKGGDTSVTAQPFMIAGAMFGSAAAVNTRQSTMATYVGLLGAPADPAVRGVPPSDTLQVGMKTFRACVAGPDIFQKAAAATLEDAKSAPYNTDGLIFTPNAAPLPLGRGTWYDQLKWKPPHDNTIDFLVLVEKERDAKGLLLAADAVGTKYREDSGQTVRYKTLRLFVGSNRDGAFADPRTTVLTADEPLPRTLDEGEWREVEFRPVDPRDRMASICYVAMGEGSGDPAGATAAATALDGMSDLIKTTRTGDTIQSDMIVEMAYHPERAPGWRWEPIRVRHDKTERWLAQQSRSSGAVGNRKSGTMNADWVANSIWNTIHNPVTEDAVRTGRIEHCGSVPAIVSTTTHGGSNSRRADLVKAQCMRNFHEYVKRMLLRRSLLPAGAIACDLAMGNGEDIGKWISAGISFFLGCDVQAAALNDKDDGAYRRLLTKMVELGGRDQVPPMLFAQADMGRVLRDGHAGSTVEDGDMLRSVFAGPMAAGADLTACLFALPYIFRDENTVAGFLTNLADTIKVGGYFVGCCTDGDAMAHLLASSPDKSVVGRDGRSDTWLLTKRYGSEIGSSVPPSAAGLGLAVEIEQVVAGTIHTEFLVSWPYLQARVAECGLDLLTPEETTTLGLPASTQMFRDTWLMAESGGDLFAMTESLKQLSFLNRWFVFKRRSDRRPAPPSLSVTLAASVAPGSRSILTEASRPTASEAIVLAAAAAGATSSASFAAAPAGAPSGTLSVIPEASESVSEKPDVIELGEENRQYLVSAANKTPDLRLGPDLADWPRYLSLGMQNTAVFTLPDLSDPSVRYPSIEAAIASAKYQRATNKAEMGATLFKIDGTIHQKFEKEREKLIATGAPPDALAKSIDDEVATVRIISGKAKMGAYKAVWDPAAWEAPGGRDDVYPAYLAQRFAVDGRFRAMIQAIKAKGGEILFVNGTDPSYLGVGVRVDGSISGGDNMVGKWMMNLTA